jgi:hypothetical protein
MRDSQIRIEEVENLRSCGFFLPEGEAIIAQDKQGAVLGQNSIRVSVP